MKEFGIRAENRVTKKRENIVCNMSLHEAESWRPPSYLKKTHKYFRVVKTANYKY